MFATGRRRRAEIGAPAVHDYRAHRGCDPWTKPAYAAVLSAYACSPIAVVPNTGVFSPTAMSIAQPVHRMRAVCLYKELFRKEAPQLGTNRAQHTSGVSRVQRSLTRRSIVRGIDRGSETGQSRVLSLVAASRSCAQRA